MAKSFPNTGATVGLAADRTAMTSMVEGQEFFETDTNKMFVYSGSGWVQTNSWSTTSGVTGVSNLIVPPACRAKRTNSTSYTSGANMSFDLEDFDTDGMHDTVTNNDRITIQTAGIYLITFTYEFSYSGTLTKEQAQINLSTGVNTYVMKYGSGAANTGGTVTVVANLAVSDYATTAVYLDGTSSITTAAGSGATSLNAIWLGRTS